MHSACRVLIQPQMTQWRMNSDLANRQQISLRVDGRFTLAWQLPNPRLSANWFWWCRSGEFDCPFVALIGQFNGLKIPQGIV